MVLGKLPVPGCPTIWITVEQGSKFFPLQVALNAEGDGLRLSHENAHPFPS